MRSDSPFKTQFKWVNFGLYLLQILSILWSQVDINHFTVEDLGLSRSVSDLKRISREISDYLFNAEQEVPRKNGDSSNCSGKKKLKFII